MYKKITTWLLTISLFCMVQNVKAESGHESFEKFLWEIGYQEISAALQKSEKHFKRSIALPTQLPPVAFTHSFGRFNNLEGKANDDFEVVFINFNSPQQHYKIRIKPIDHRLEFKEGDIDQKFTLKDGSDALFIRKKLLGFYLLVFEKDGWQYVLSIDKRIADQVTPEVLVSIANSVKPKQ